MSDTLQEHFGVVKNFLHYYKEKDITDDLRIAAALFETNIFALENLMITTSADLDEATELFSIQDGDTVIGDCIIPMNTRDAFWNSFLRNPCFCGFRVIKGKVRFCVISSGGIGDYILVCPK